jgi:hypothetical protein
MTQIWLGGVTLKIYIALVFGYEFICFKANSRVVGCIIQAV